MGLLKRAFSQDNCPDKLDMLNDTKFKETVAVGEQFVGNTLFSHEATRILGTTVHVGFTGKGAGNLGLHVGNDPERVLANRVALEDALDPGGHFVYLNQVHGTEVCDADTDGVTAAVLPLNREQAVHVREAAPVADAAVSCQGQPLAVMVADCIPLLLAGEAGEDPSRLPVLAVAHAGRRGLLAGVIQRTVEAMVDRGASRIQVWLGPSICGSCYEVPEDMREDSQQICERIGSRTSWGTPALDLKAAACEILESLPEVWKVHTDRAACTLETPDLYSHRRGEVPGRFAGLVWIDRKGR